VPGSKYQIVSPRLLLTVAAAKSRNASAPGAREDDPQHFGRGDRLAVLMALHHMFGGRDVCAIMTRHERRLVEVAMDRRDAITSLECRRRSPRIQLIAGDV